MARCGFRRHFSLISKRTLSDKVAANVKILIASSEVFPYSKTGGLADMVGALSKALAVDGHAVTVVTPLYRGIRQKHRQIEETTQTMTLPLGGVSVTAKIWSTTPVDGVTVLFVDQPEFFDRRALYGESGSDYPDNAARFIFFSKAVADIARNADEPFEIIHVHDWQVGLVPLFVRYGERSGTWDNPPASVITIHNLAYQGVFPYQDYLLTNLPNDYFATNGVEFYNRLNCLKAGLVFADMITTVSPRYAREIMTEKYGCGLDGVIRARQERLMGILNGVDYSEWNTETNPMLKFHYTLENFTGKAQQKAALQAEMGLPVDPSVPLFGTVSRLADQKGIDIAITALEEMLSTRMQFVLLGSGDPEFERGFKLLQERYPEKVSVRIGYDHGLSHRIEAGCDFFLMPSRFEPCGLNQMYSLRYGTIPIVRVTGGLDDSVTDITEHPENADGIKFFEYSARALSKAIRKALALFENKELLEHYRRNAMSVDYSWEHTTHEYEAVYRRAQQLKSG
jgi:starch synthase